MTGGAPSRWRHPIVGRSAWTFADQAASSSSNFLVALCILATADRMEFAAFSVAMTGFLLVTQLTRSAFSLPVLILYSGRHDHDRSTYGPAVAASVVTGLFGALAFLVAGALYPDGRLMFFALAGGLPLLLYQDAMRHVAFARGVPKVAAGSDALWVACQLAGTAVIAATGHATPAALLLIWVIGGAAAGIVLGVRLGVVPSIRQCRRWLGENRALCARMSTEFVLNSGSYYVLSYGLVAVAGADQLGRWRAAQTLIGPVSVLLLGGTTLGVPESVRVRDRAKSLRRFAVILSAGLGAVAVAGGALAYAALPAAGPTFFPDTWSTARPVLPALTGFAAAVGASSGAIAALRARGEAHWIVLARAVSGALALGLGLALAARSGAVGALAGLALSESAFAIAAWARLLRTIDRPIGDPVTAGPVAPVAG